MGVVGLGNELEEGELIGVLVVGKGYLRDEPGEGGLPVLTGDGAIRRPVLKDVPPAEESQKLVAGVGEFDLRVGRFVIEGRIVNAGNQRDKELFAGSIGID
ncbi:hypothetical protein [Edaphobacter aggregans]|uniref:hypothetical protein n=1 Tax=Edaphobacter aggregans TaxID=570835 RepID=UPI000553E0A6|nr:hypothetical protein [Edaphobacter aggregans]